MSPHKRTGLLAVAIVGGVAVLLFAVVGVVIAQKDATGKPRADKEGETWTHRELVDYLEKNGIELSVYKTDEKSPNGPEVEYFGPGATVVAIQRCPSADKAKEIAGLGRKDRQFSWGRFSIFAGENLFEKIRQLLG